MTISPPMISWRTWNTREPSQSGKLSWKRGMPNQKKPTASAPSNTPLWLPLPPTISIVQTKKVPITLEKPLGATLLISWA